MRKMILISFLVLLFPTVLLGQNKVEAPVWSIGDKWNLTGDVTIMVVSADEGSYGVKYLTSGGESVLICEKPSLNRLYAVDRNRRTKYEGRNRRLFNFPLDIGKTWKDQFVVKPAALAEREKTYLETFTVLGWEDVEVQTGKMKALKIEYKQEGVEQQAGRPKEGKVWYWYSPDVKYMVKCQYEKTEYWDASYDWELTSFQLRK